MRISDWSSDVCSSDLQSAIPPALPVRSLPESEPALLFVCVLPPTVSAHPCRKFPEQWLARHQFHRGWSIFPHWTRSFVQPRPRRVVANDQNIRVFHRQVGQRPDRKSTRLSSSH